MLTAIAKRGLAGFVPPSRSAGAVVFTAFVDSLGTGVYLAGASIFFVKFAGLTIAQVGVGLSVAGAAAFLSKVPLGSLADRFGARNILVIVQALRGVVFIALAFVNDFPQYLVVCLAMGLLEGPVSPLTQAVVGSVVIDSDRIRTLAIVRSVRNVAFSLGALAASPLLAIGTTWSGMSIMFLNGASFFVAALLMSRVVVIFDQSVKARVSLGAVVRSFRNGPYLALATLSGAMSVYTSVLMIGIPLWAVGVGKVDAGVVPLLIAVNTVLSVVLQVPLSRIAERPGGGVRSLLVAAVALAFSFLTLGAVVWVSTGWAIVLIAVGVVALTIGEVTHTAGEWELSYAYADASRRSLYLSVFNLGEAAQSIVGPALLTVALIPAGWAGWLAAAVLMLACIPLVRLSVRALDRSRGAQQLSETS